MQKIPHRPDYVPAEPVRRALRRWLTEHDLGGDGTANRRSEDTNYVSPYVVLAEKTGWARDTIYAHINRERNDHMQFDVADKLLCVIEQSLLWHCDPELSQAYERAVKGADQIYPVVEPEAPAAHVRTCDHCGEKFETWRRWGTPRRFCGQPCRQAAYKERLAAA